MTKSRARPAFGLEAVALLGGRVRLGEGDYSGGMRMV